MKEMTIVVRVFAQVAVDLIAEVYDIDELPEIVEEYSSYVEDCGIKAAIEHYGGTTKDYGITDREPEVRDIDRDEFFDSVNSFVDRVNDSDWYNADDPVGEIDYESECIDRERKMANLIKDAWQLLA